MAKKNLLKFTIIMLSLLLSLITVTEVFAAEIVVDDSGAGFTTTGSWNSYSNSCGYNGNYHYETTTNPSDTATWTPTITSDGYYKVYVHYCVHSARPAAVPYTIVDADGTTIVNVDQTKDASGNTVADFTASGWKLLGTFRFTTAGGQYVELDTSDAGDTCADAVKFVSPTVVYVDDDYTDVASCTAAGHEWNYDCFNKIQDGVNAVDSEGTVNVAAGTYDEQVVINKPLTLQGIGDSTIVKPSSEAKLVTILSGNYFGSATQFSGIIVANVPSASVTIKNLKVDGSGIAAKPAGVDYVAGIFYRDTGGVVDTVTVSDVRCNPTQVGKDCYGIYLSSTSSPVTVEVNDSTVTDFDKNGIQACGSMLIANVNENTIIGRGPLPSGDEVQNGVVLGDGATGHINGNIISDMSYNPLEWWSTGILFYEAGGSADDNIINDVQSGIIFQDGSGSAEGNIVNGGTVGIIGLWAQFYNTGIRTVSFVNNTMSNAKDSWGYGLPPTGKYQNAAIGAQTYNVGTSLALTINRNQVTSASSTDADGIYIGDIPGNSPAGNITTTISNNVISGWEYGIHVLSSVSNSMITGNTISGNVYEGVQLNGTNSPLNNVTISQNTIYNNSRHGILLIGQSNNNTISGNTVYGNTYAAIALWSPSSPYPSNNLIYLNKIFKGSVGTSYTAGDWGSNNQWNDTTKGNWWSDLSTNLGYLSNPIRYNILQGSAGAIDWHPIILPTVWVDDDYNETACITSGYTWQYDCFNKIQDGVNAVAGNGTINVAAGTYTEHVVISKPLALNGPNKNKNPNAAGRIDEAIVSTDDLTNHQAILIDSFGVSISGFTVYGPNGAIKDIGAIGMTGTGPRTNVTIKYNKIYRTASETNWTCDGIRLDFPNDDASVTIQYNLINVGNTTMEDGNNDITIADMAYTNAHRLTWIVNSTDRTKILNNYFYGHSKIYLEGTGALIDGNRFSGIWGPIEVRGSKDVVIKNNIMIDQTDVGIYVWSPKVGNSGAGLSSDISITNNKIQGMKLDPQDFTDEGTGIILGGVTNALVEKNTIMNNAGNGVVIGGEGYDHFDHSWGLGVGVYQPVNNIIRKNSISGNTMYAVKVDSTVASGSSGNAVLYNNFIDNEDAQARDDGLSGATQWDDGTKGNWWSDWRYNTGYPTVYNLEGTARSKDNHPSGSSYASASIIAKNGGVLNQLDTYTSFKPNTKITLNSFSADRNQKLSGNVFISIKTETTDGKTISASLTIALNKINKFNSNVIDADGTGKLRISVVDTTTVPRPTRSSKTYSLNYVNLYVDPSTNKLNFIGKTTESGDLKIQITGMDVTKFGFSERNTIPYIKGLPV